MAAFSYLSAEELDMIHNVKVHERPHLAGSTSLFNAVSSIEDDEDDEGDDDDDDNDDNDDDDDDDEGDDDDEQNNKVRTTMCFAAQRLPI
jgi:hypothetical protein